MTKRTTRKSTRREFLKLAAAGAGLALGGSLPSRARAGTPRATSEDLTKYKGAQISVVSMPGGSRAINDDAVKLFMEKSGAVVKTVDYPMSEMITKYVTSFLSGKH